VDSNICTGSTPVPGTKPDEKSSGFFCLSPINKDIGIEEVVAMRVLRCWR
jgi:hypothetical protein